jgi:hypothetical protein
MKLWKDSQEEVKRIAPDRQMAKAILKMIEVRMKALSLVDRKEFASLVVEDYYEITKEAITALMALDGYKTLSHEVLVAYLKEFYPQFSESEILLVDQLRQLRNKIAYKGFFITHDFLERTEARMKSIVSKIKRILEDGLAR